jgi:hypothetical protein
MHVASVLSICYICCSALWLAGTPELHTHTSLPISVMRVAPIVKRARNRRLVSKRSSTPWSKVHAHMQSESAPNECRTRCPYTTRLGPHGGACSRCQHMSHWSLSHIRLHALCFLSHIGYARYALSRIQLGRPTHMLSRIGAASNRRRGAQQYAQTSRHACLSIDVRALAWLACNKGKANMYGWKQNGNIPNRIVSFSIFNPIESVFSCPTSPFSFSYFKCKSRK